MPTQLYAIARNTFTESIRQPIFLATLGTWILLLPTIVAMTRYTFDNDDVLMIETCLSAILVGGVVLSCFTASGVLAREIDNKTVLTVLSKSVSRPTLLLGKYFGVVAAVLLAFWIWTMLFVLLVRHGVVSTARDQIDQPVLTFSLIALFLAVAIATWGNYFYQWLFIPKVSLLSALFLTLAWLAVLMIDPHWQFQSITTEFLIEDQQLFQIFKAQLMIFFALTLVCAVAIASSTRLGQVPTLLICFGFCLIALTSDYLVGQHVQTHWIARWTYPLLPNLQLLWMSDALMQKAIVPMSYLIQAAIYTFCYTLAVLSLAMLLFARREIG